MQCPHCFDNLIEEFGEILHEWEGKVKEFARCLTCGHEGHSPKFFNEDTFDTKTCPDENMLTAERFKNVLRSNIPKESCKQDSTGSIKSEWISKEFEEI